MLVRVSTGNFEGATGQAIHRYSDPVHGPLADVFVRGILVARGLPESGITAVEPEYERLPGRFFGIQQASREVLGQ